MKEKTKKGNLGEKTQLGREEGERSNATLQQNIAFMSRMP